ncbi:MAG: branched-chain amino acid ABC transporter permease [Deferrisomatales bacterium]|nr:branched-chain amino acid ABC transporter permease [Deferrisomatales bacterium]
MRQTRFALTVLLALVALCAVTGPLLSTYYVGLLCQALIFALFAMSLDILVGYVGLPSLGHAAFFGVGAYAAGLLTLHFTHSFWWCALAGVGAALAVGALFGLLTVRTAGSSFLMITLALAQILWGVAFKWRSLTGGEDGLPGIVRPDLGFPWDVTSMHSYFYLVLVFFTLCGVGMALFVRSPFGLALQGVRESESRMQALGYNVWAYKYLGYLFASAVAGFAGVLYVYYNRFVSPNDLGIALSAKGLLMVILGGTGTLIGPVLGAGVIVVLEHVVSSYTQRWMMAIGVVYVLVVLFFPKGVLGALGERVRKGAR